MITKQRPFQGDSRDDVIAAILNADPVPVATLVPDAPPDLERVLNRTLSKSRDTRYHSSGDLHLELLALRSSLRQRGASSAKFRKSVQPPERKDHKKPTGARMIRLGASVLAVLLASIAVGGLLLRQPTGSNEPHRPRDRRAGTAPSTEAERVPRAADRRDILAGWSPHRVCLRSRRQRRYLAPRPRTWRSGSVDPVS